MCVEIPGIGYCVVYLFFVGIKLQDKAQYIYIVVVKQLLIKTRVNSGSNLIWLSIQSKVHYFRF